MSDTPHSIDLSEDAMNPATRRPEKAQTEEKWFTHDAPSIKVLQVLYTGLGGHGSVVFSLIQADRGKRWKSSLAFVGIESLLSSYKELCERFGVEDYAVFQFPAGRPLFAWWKLYRWIARVKPDVILVHSLSALLPCYLWRLTSGAKLIAIEHTPVEMKSPRDLAFSALSQRVTDGVVCLSPISRDSLLKRLGTFGSSKRIAVIPNGVDPRFFSPGQKTYESGVIHLGMAGRFAGQKRQDILIDMLEIIVRQRPDLQVKLSFAGGGETLDDIRAAAQRARVADRVEFLGTLDEERLADWYRELDIYLHAAQAENMPTAVLQAMATALPVISTDIPPMRVVLEARAQNGILVQNNDGRAFAEAVIDLIDDPIKRRILGETARTTAVAVFGSDAMFRSYDAICRRKIGSEVAV